MILPPPPSLTLYLTFPIQVSVVRKPTCEITSPASDRLVNSNISLVCEMEYAGEKPTLEWKMESEEEGLGDVLESPENQETKTIGIGFNFTILQRDVGRKVICKGGHKHWNETIEM